MTAALATVITIFGLCGCETTAERSAELRRAAKHAVFASRGVSVSRESPSVRVLYCTVVRSREGAAVVVGLRNDSTHTIESAPIEVAVRDAKGAVLFQNDQAGIEPSLTHVSVLAPGAVTVWVDDQVPVSGVPVSASALVGEGHISHGHAPELSVAGTHVVEEAGAGSGAAGTVKNRSGIAQQHLVVFLVARKRSGVVAAGRAILPEVGVGASVPFQAYFVGSSKGARIQASAPATTF